MNPITTPRLTLHALAPVHWRAMRVGAPEFARVFGHTAADGLCDFMSAPEISPAFLAKIAADTGPDVWSFGVAMLHRDSDSVIGTVGFKGAPDAQGMVEIAYGVVPSFERQGIATEATRAMARWALTQDGVRLVRAHTAPEVNSSMRVLAKCGFVCLGEVIDPDDGREWRWEMGP